MWEKTGAKVQQLSYLSDIGILDIKRSQNKDMQNSNNNIMCLTLTALGTIIFLCSSYDDAAASLNITRTLLLQVNVTGIGAETEKEIIADDYKLTMFVKGNRYSDHVIIPLSKVLHQDNTVEIPIINNEDQEDDGSDFRIDIWVNNYDKKFQKVNYPIKYNTTFKSVDITDMVDYVLEDTRAEKAEDADNNDEEQESAEYSIIKDRPDNNGDERPHAKIKDPKDD